MKEAIATGESFEPLKSGNPIYSNHERFNLQSDSKDLNGKLDVMYWFISARISWDFWPHLERACCRDIISEFGG